MVKNMCGIGAAHTDPKVKKEWNNKADDLEKTSKIQKAILSKS